MVLGAAARLASWSQVFVDGRIYPGGPDGYYHLRRALLILREWPHVPQVDPWLNAPGGGLISWPPLFDFLLATLALPWRGAPHHALESIGAWLPLLLGVAQVLLVARIATLLRGPRAGAIAALVAAILPGAVRYSMLGALDHDPFFETAVLASMLAIARESDPSREKTRISSVFLLAASLAGGVLAWTGAIVQMAVVFCAVAVVVLLRPAQLRVLGPMVSLGSLLAAAVVAPFALDSVWTKASRATFEGLSLLHVAVLVGIAFTAGAASWIARRGDRSIAGATIVAGAAALYLVPLSVVPFIQGFLYATGHATILSAVAEARPLLYLRGPFDLRPALVRITLLPLVGALILARDAWKSRDASAGAALAWFGVTIVLALTHSRFSYSAALAGAVVAGMAVDTLLRTYTPARTAFAVAALSLTLVAAYIEVPGFEGFSLPSRTNDLRSAGLEELIPAMRSREGVVVAPWYLGHWILWLADRPVAMSPMLSVGQDRFFGTLGLYFEKDAGRLASQLDARSAAWLIVTADATSVAEEAAVAGVPPGTLVTADGIDLRAYMDTVAGRLALAGNETITFNGRTYPATPRLREVSRSSALVDTPFGPRPLLRLYEVLPR